MVRTYFCAIKCCGMHHSHRTTEWVKLVLIGIEKVQHQVQIKILQVAFSLQSTSKVYIYTYTYMCVCVFWISLWSSVESGFGSCGRPLPIQNILWFYIPVSVNIKKIKIKYKIGTVFQTDAACRLWKDNLRKKLWWPKLS